MRTINLLIDSDDMAEAMDAVHALQLKQAIGYLVSWGIDGYSVVDIHPDGKTDLLAVYTDPATPIVGSSSVPCGATAPSPTRSIPEEIPMPLNLEVTDTFGGEPNYCWVKRSHQGHVSPWCHPCSQEAGWLGRLVPSRWSTTTVTTWVHQWDNDWARMDPSPSSGRHRPTIPKERRDADWRIAQGLLIEAALLVKANNDDMAEAMRQSAAPYLRFAEII
jgi:hypothetical protein